MVAVTLSTYKELAIQFQLCFLDISCYIEQLKKKFFLARSRDIALVRTTPVHSQMYAYCSTSNDSK